MLSGGPVIRAAEPGRLEGGATEARVGVEQPAEWRFVRVGIV
jgi:hypothetical protein